MGSRLEVESARRGGFRGVARCRADGLSHAKSRRLGNHAPDSELGGRPDPHRQRAAALPVIALTAAALPEKRARCVEASMNDFLAKPVKLAEIRRILRGYTNRGSRSSATTV